MMSSELDVLLVGYNEERFAEDIRQAFRHWQVYPVSNPFALEGRRFRRVYITVGAYKHRNWIHVDRVLAAAVRRDPRIDILPFSEFQPEYAVPTVDEAELLTAIRRSRHPVS